MNSEIFLFVIIFALFVWALYNNGSEAYRMVKYEELEQPYVIQQFFILPAPYGGKWINIESFGSQDACAKRLSCLQYEHNKKANSQKFSVINKKEQS